MLCFDLRSHNSSVLASILQGALRGRKELKRTVQIAFMLLLLPVILIACGGGEDEDDSSALSAEDAPTINIVSPEEGATVSGETINIRMDITNFIQDGGAIGNAMVPGRGHWHLRLDDGVLASGGVEDLEYLMGSAGDFFGHDIPYFC